MASKTKYFDDVFDHKEKGEVVLTAWVFENNHWTYRTVTPEELGEARLLDFDLSNIKED